MLKSYLERKNYTHDFKVIVCPNVSHSTGMMPNKEREKKLYRLIPLIGFMYKSFGKHKNSNHTLAEQKQELLNENSVLWEENKDYRRLKRAVGEERSKYLIQNEKSREMAEKNRRKDNKRSHDRDAR